MFACLNTSARLTPLLYVWLKSARYRIRSAHNKIYTSCDFSSSLILLRTYTGQTGRDHFKHSYYCCAVYLKCKNVRTCDSFHCLMTIIFLYIYRSKYFVTKLAWYYNSTTVLYCNMYQACNTIIIIFVVFEVTSFWGLSLTQTLNDQFFTLIMMMVVMFYRNPEYLSRVYFHQCYL